MEREVPFQSITEEEHRWSKIFVLGNLVLFFLKLFLCPLRHIIVFSVLAAAAITAGVCPCREEQTSTVSEAEGDFGPALYLVNYNVFFFFFFFLCGFDMEHRVAAASWPFWERKKQTKKKNQHKKA